MPFRKLSYYGNQFIGIFGNTNNKITVVPNGTSDKFFKISEYLKTKTIKATISESDLIGLFSVMNDKAMLVSPVIYDNEELQLRKQLKFEGMDLFVLDTKLTAIGNNIVTNNKKAIVNPKFPEEVVKKIRDSLDVEILRIKIANYNVVGSVVLTTNKGFVAHPDIEEKQFQEISDFLGLKGGIATANKGVPFVSLCMIANDNGMVFGEPTTAFEIQKLMDALDQS